MTVDASQFKDALKLWASGVTVVTTADRGGQLKGMTATAFSSVSMEPPQILVCLNQRTDTGNGLLESRFFGVNILTREQEAVSNQFAGNTTQAERFAAVPWVAGQTGVPLLSDSLASLECRVVQQIQAGSHWIVVGEVEHAICRQGDPLLYYSGGYRGLDK